MNGSHHITNLICSHFLDTMTQLQKVTSFVMSVYMEQLGYHHMDFHKI